MIIMTLPVTLAAIVGLVYTWVLTYREVRAAEAVTWRQRVAWVSVAAVTGQVLLCGASFYFFPNRRRAIDWMAGMVAFLFVVALPCAILRKGFARWWILFGSTYFLAFAGFVWLVSGIVF